MTHFKLWGWSWKDSYDSLSHRSKYLITTPYGAFICETGRDESFSVACQRALRFGAFGVPNNQPSHHKVFIPPASVGLMEDLTQTCEPENS